MRTNIIYNLSYQMILVRVMANTKVVTEGAEEPCV